jgi:cell wall assembly regulator SMI1
LVFAKRRKNTIHLTPAIAAGVMALKVINMNKAFEKFKNWLSENYADGLNELSDSATDKDILEVENKLGVKLPEELIEFLKIHNGQAGDSGYLCAGYRLISTSDIISEWECWKELSDGGDFDDCIAEPDSQIKSSWWNKKWVAFAENGSGDSLCLDLDPTDEGLIGQVITMNHDEEERKMLSSNFKKWFEEYVEKVLIGEYVYSDYYGAIVHKDEIF